MILGSSAPAFTFLLPFNLSEARQRLRCIDWQWYWLDTRDTVVWNPVAEKCAPLLQLVQNSSGVHRALRFQFVASARSPAVKRPLCNAQFESACNRTSTPPYLHGYTKTNFTFKHMIFNYEWFLRMYLTVRFWSIAYPGKQKFRQGKHILSPNNIYADAIHVDGSVTI